MVGEGRGSEARATVGVKRDRSCLNAAAKGRFLAS